jgi:succinate dehydrogenase / fumarate reductase membrane anchor subunit
MGTGTSIGRVRGLGSAHHGPHHWWHQKITAGSNILLMSWLMIALARRPSYDFGAMREWMSSSWVAIPMLLLVASVFYHFRLGLQVVIEDYQREESKIVAMVALNLFTAIVAGIAIFAILKIAFGAAN